MYAGNASGNYCRVLPWRTLMIHWMSVCIVLSGILETDGEEESRVCYTSSARPEHCSVHHLECDNGYKISVNKAAYGYLTRRDFKKCRCGKRKCDSCDDSTDSPQECLKPQRHADLWNVVSNCSYKQQCLVSQPQPRNNTCRSSYKTIPRFSKIEYECLKGDNVVDFCRGNKSGNYLSILYTMTPKENNCLCNITRKGKSKRSIKVTSLDIRNASSDGGGYFKLTFKSNDKVQSFINQTLEQDELLFQASGSQQITTVRLYVNGNDSPEQIWIKVDASTSSQTSRVTLTSSSISTATPSSSADTRISTVTMDAAGMSQMPPSTDHVAPITVGITGGLFVIAVSAAVLLFCCTKRKKSQKCIGEERNSHTNPSYGVVSSDTIYPGAGSIPEEDGYSRLSNIMSSEPAAEPDYFQLEGQEKNPNYMNVDVPPVDHKVVLEVPSKPSGAAYVEIENQSQNPTNLNGNSTDETYDHASLIAKSTLSQVPLERCSGVTGDEDCYNHLGTNRHQPTEWDYDTAAAATKAVQEMEGDRYTYDHLGESAGTTVRGNDYDTTTLRVLNY